MQNNASTHAVANPRHTHSPNDIMRRAAPPSKPVQFACPEPRHSTTGGGCGGRYAPPGASNSGRCGPFPGGVGIPSMCREFVNPPPLSDSRHPPNCPRGDRGAIRAGSMYPCTGPVPSASWRGCGPSPDGVNSVGCPPTGGGASGAIVPPMTPPAGGRTGVRFTGASLIVTRLLLADPGQQFLDLTDCRRSLPPGPAGIRAHLDV